MKPITFKLHPNQLLKEGMEQIILQENIKAGVLWSLVGSLDNAVLGMPVFQNGLQVIKEWKGPFEIVSGTGTISKEGCHIHVSLADREGHVIGGHLKEGCRVKYLAEIVIGVFEDLVYKRPFNEESGYSELEIEPPFAE